MKTAMKPSFKQLLLPILLASCLYVLSFLIFSLRGPNCCVGDRKTDVCNKCECVGRSSAPDPFSNDGNFRDNRNKVFFHETSAAAALKTRQACAVESLALHNPDLTVYVLMTNEASNSHPTMRALQEYGNINLVQINLDDYFFNTPLERWYFCTNWRNGRYAVSHLSDALRYLTLFKYGGYYFDLDFIMMKPVSSLRNFVGLETNNVLGAGAMHADLGHSVFQQTIQEFRDNYKRDAWGHNGPLLITRVLKRSCPDLHNCTTFNVLRREIFYPVSYTEWEYYFSEKPSVRLEKSIGIHVWNKLSGAATAIKNSSQVYVRMARKNCPRVFAVADALF